MRILSLLSDRQPANRHSTIAAVALTLLAAVPQTVEANAATAASWHLALNNVGEICLAVALLSLCLATGLTLLSRLELVPSDPVLRISLSAGLGAGTLAAFLLGVGALVGVTAGTLGIGIGAAVLAARDELPRVKYLAEEATRRFRESVGPAGTASVALLLVGALLFAVAPTLDWDSLAYHLEVPKTWLGEGRIFLPPDNLHTAYIGLPHLLYLPMMAVGGKAAPAVFNVGFTGLLGVSVFGWARDTFDREVGVVSTLLLWGSPILLLVGMTARVDTTLVFFLVTAHWLLLGVTDGRLPARFLPAAAALLGFAVGIKYTALLYAAVLVPMVAVAWLSGRGHARGSRGSPLRTLAWTGAAFSTAIAPWMLKNWFLMGTPLSGLVGGPELPLWLSELDLRSKIGSDVVSSLAAFPGSLREPFDLLAFFGHPERLTPETEAPLYGGNPFFLLLPLWILWWRDTKLLQVGLPALLFGVGILVYSTTTNLRYLMPALPGLTVASAALLVRAGRKLPGTRWFLGSASTFAIGASLLALLAKFSWSPVAAAAAGLATPAEFRQRHDQENATAAYSEVARYTSRALGPQDRLLLLYEPREFLFQVDAIQDVNALPTWPLLSRLLEDDPGCLPGPPFTHVLINHAIPGYFAEHGVPEKLLRTDQMQEFVSNCLQKQYSTGRYVLYRLRERPRRGAPMKTNRDERHPRQDPDTSSSP